MGDDGLPICVSHEPGPAMKERDSLEVGFGTVIGKAIS